MAGKGKPARLARDGLSREKEGSETKKSAGANASQSFTSWGNTQRTLEVGLPRTTLGTKGVPDRGF